MDQSVEDCENWSLNEEENYDHNENDVDNNDRDDHDHDHDHDDDDDDDDGDDDDNQDDRDVDDEPYNKAVPSTSSAIMKSGDGGGVGSSGVTAMDGSTTNSNHFQPRPGLQQHSGDSRRVDKDLHLGAALYGWRKKCLYVLILGLMVLIIVNLALTLWILKVMEFSSEGMGQLKVVAGGLQLSGQALVLDILRASSIRSRHGQPVTIESSKNFSVYTRGTDGFVENHLFLGHERFECMANTFRVTDQQSNVLFSVDREAVTIGANSLRIDGEGGGVFRNSIQTPLIRAEPGRDLKLESPTRKLDIRASQTIFLESRAGGMDFDSLGDIKVRSVAGSIRLDASSIMMTNLKIAQLAPQGPLPQNREHSHKVYQLCVCSNGKLFIAPPHGLCVGDESTVCR